MDFVNAECIIADSTGWADTLTHITEVEGAQMHVDCIDMAFSDQCVNLVLKTIYKLFYCQAQVQVHFRPVHNHSHTKDLGL